MSRSAGNQTTTQTSEPPKYLQPYLKGAAQSAANLYGQGGTPVVPFSPQTQMSLNLAENRALQGSPVTNAAQSYATNVLNGGMMGANPYLDATFNRAANAVTNQVQSNFARAGRNAGGSDAAGVAAMHYGDLANQIYGGDYQAERTRQQQLIPFTTGLANQDYTDIGQLANVGTTYENLAQRQAAQPENSLNQYLAQLAGLSGGYGVQTGSTPLKRSVLGDAASGAAAGSMFGPWGMLGGAILGGAGVL